MNWNIIYQIFGVSLMAILSIVVYKIFLTSNRSKSGIPRSS